MTFNTQGKPRKSSDIYALGMTCIQVLTGIDPISLQEDEKGEIIWRKHSQTSNELAAIISKMVLYDFRERYQTVNEVIVALNSITPSEFENSTFFLQSQQQKEHNIVSRLEDIRVEPNRLQFQLDTFELEKKQEEFKLEIERKKLQLEMEHQKQVLELETIKLEARYGRKSQVQLFYIKTVTSLVLIGGGIFFAYRGNDIGGFMIGSGVAGVGITSKTELSRLAVERENTDAP